MYDTGGTQSVCDLRPADYDVGARLNRLARELARDGDAPRGLRRGLAGAGPDSMTRPLGTARAFARLGLLLGLFPPAAIFARLLWLARGDRSFLSYLLLFVVMNVVCAAVGRLAGGWLGRSVDRLEQRSWALTLVAPALLGFVWGVVTGGAGGLIVFGIGALFGAACAVPVGAAAFAAFTPLHRLLARGGMIEERQFWPLACGVTGVVTALILSPQLFA